MFEKELEIESSSGVNCFTNIVVEELPSEKEQEKIFKDFVKQFRRKHGLKIKVKKWNKT